MKYKTILSAEMKPYVYGGARSDEHWPMWHVLHEDDTDEDTDDRIITLYPGTFPPGTIVTVQEPVCPKCKSRPYFDMKWKCLDDESCDDESCDFDWYEWAAEEYS